MKNYWIILLLGFTSLIWACKGDSAASNDSALETPSGTIASAAQPVDNSREAQLLTKDFWVFEFYVVPGNQQESQANRGRWFDFQPDGKFSAGHWEEQTANGVWRLDRREGKIFLILDADFDPYDAEWQIEPNGPGDAMSWVGTKNYERSNHMIKVISLLTRPTRKQFGLE